MLGAAVEVPGATVEVPGVADPAGAAAGAGFVNPLNAAAAVVKILAAMGYTTDGSPDSI